MITNPPQLGALVDDLARSTWTLAAIGVLFDSGVADLLQEPHTVDELVALGASAPRDQIARCLAVLATRGVVTSEGDRFQLAPGVMPYLEPGMREGLRGECRSHLMQPLAYLDGAARLAAPGWRHSDPALLQAQGDTSAGFATGFARRMMHGLDDLPARVGRDGARFLDVGVGVAALSIAMCRELPHVHAVGLDVLDAPLAIARDNIARAGMTDRIELRQLAVQDLRDEAAFDFAWLPSFFIPPQHVAAAVARVRASLRPGGWLLMPSVKLDLDDDRRTVWSMASGLWGGPVLGTAEVEALMGTAGFTTLRALPGPSWITIVVAQR